MRAYVVPQDEELARMQCGEDGVIREDEHTAALQQEILDELKLHVAGYALPREFVFRRALPKTLVGKVAFRLLEEEADREEEKMRRGEIGLRGQQKEEQENTRRSEKNGAAV